ncbi:MAG: MFS transporter [Sporolactobacillus sp.]
MKVKHLLMKLAVLLISIFIVSAGATAATVPLMIKSFPAINSTTIELLMTLPSLGIVVFTPLSNFIADKFGEKRTILTGLWIVLISGIIPAMTMNFTLIFISRITIGVGTGFIAAFSQSLILQLFEGEEQQRMIGLSSVVQGLGMFILTYFAGTLMNINWQASYLVYLIVLPILLLFWVFIPTKVGVGTPENDEASANVKSSKKIDGVVLILSLFAFLFNSVFAFITIRFAMLVVSRHYGTAADASTLLGIMAFAMAAGGFIFMYLQKHVKKFSMAVALGFATAAYFLLSISNSLLISAVGVVFIGMAVSIFMASMIALINVMTSKYQAPFSTSIAMTMANVGTLLSPYVAQLLSRALGNSTPTFTFLCGTVVFCALFLVAVFAGIKYDNLTYAGRQTTTDTVHERI